jgi:hypothetical protein
MKVVVYGTDNDHASRYKFKTTPERRICNWHEGLMVVRIGKAT